MLDYSNTKIFIIRNPENKVYIIYTTKDIIRLKYYLSSLEKSGKNNKLVNSLVNYTVANHTIELIEEGNYQNKEQLNRRLLELYNQYNSINNGLNEHIPYNGMTKKEYIKNYNSTYQKTEKYKLYKKQYFLKKKTIN